MSFTDKSHLDLLHKKSREATYRLLKPFKFGTKRSPFPPAATEAEQPIIPNPKVFCSLAENLIDGASRTKIKTNDIPTVGECAVHLELLEAFLVLKTRVLQSNVIDRAFGIAAPAGKRINLKTLRERKWKGYVAIAVIRFEKWWQNIDRVLSTARKEAESPDTRPELTISTLPPLDVLMVWHTLMLTPMLYRGTCDKQYPDFWKVEMPWSALHEVIDASSRGYNLPTPAAALFNSITGFQSDLFAILTDFSNLSDNARKILALTEDREISFSDHWELHKGLSSNTQDAMFKAYLERENFFLPRFKFDARRYINKTVKHTFTEAFPQLKGTEERYLGALMKLTFSSTTDMDKVTDLKSLRRALNDALSSPYFPKRQRNFLYEVAIERLLSSYAPTPRNVNLSETEAAIFRQGEFVDKMGNLLWIRSPSVDGTLSRAISRYEKFFLLLKAYPDKIIVPTLDIDIVWHTHQCAPARYFAYSKVITGRFINHDDSIAKVTLDKSLKDTKDLFYEHFEEEYSRCLCWDCEALLTAAEEVIAGAGEEADIAQRVTEDVAYYRAVEMARREGKMLPIRK